MLIRPVVMPSDLPALQVLWRTTWRDTYGPLLGLDRLHLIDEAIAEPGVLTMFAADGGGLVGSVGDDVVGSVCFAERHGVGYVWGMYVHPMYQRRGIGSALLKAAAEDMVEAETVMLSTVTSASAAFYRRLGFAEVGRSDFEPFPGVTCASSRLSIAARDLRAGSPSLA